MSFWTKKKKSLRLSWSQRLSLKTFRLLYIYKKSSYLKNRVQRVFTRGSYSSEGTVKYGVPQGSVFGPVLFCIFIDDRPLYIPSHSAEYHMLVDDTTLHSTGKRIVQIQIRISVWCNTNHMLINPVKTTSMVITTRQKHQLSDLSLSLSLDVRILKM